jgi:hypothetical protein
MFLTQKFPCNPLCLGIFLTLPNIPQELPNVAQCPLVSSHHMKKIFQHFFLALTNVIAFLWHFSSLDILLVARSSPYHVSWHLIVIQLNSLMSFGTFPMLFVMLHLDVSTCFTRLVGMFKLYENFDGCIIQLNM